MAMTAFSPLGTNGNIMRGGYPNILELPELVKIAEKHGMTTAQVALRWSYQEGIAIIPKSIKEHRLKENIAAVTDFVLDEDDMALIRTLDTGRHICGSVFFGGLTEEEFWNHD